MKVGKLFLGLFIVGALSTSCKKDYTCECKDVFVLGEVNIEIENAKKSDAEDACDSAQATYRTASASATCTLK